MTEPRKTSDVRIESARRWKAENREHLLEFNRKRNAAIRADPVLWAAKLAANSRSAKRNREKRKEYDRSREFAKQSARRIVRNRVYRGTLEKKPCEVCGRVDSQAHHDDYSKPLAIRWLCSTHHAMVHNILKATNGNK